MFLKPQDLVVALKLCRYRDSQRPPYAELSQELKLSVSEVHAAMKRAEAARLLGPAALGHRPNLPALEEFLIHGVKYAFAPERGQPTRGIPTAHAAPPLNTLVLQGEEPPPVWPYAEGTTKGIAFQPLYPTVPFAALRDEFLYECLALVDALRDGRAREKKLAEEELKKRLHGEWEARKTGTS